MTLGSRRTGRRLLAPLVAAALSLPIAAVTAGPAQAAPTVMFTARAAGLSQPTQVTSARDGRARMFVVEKTGLVRIFAGGKMRGRPFLDLRSRVRTDGEGGLLSIAFDPQYRTHPVLWAAYTSTSGVLRVARFRARTATANRVPLSSYHRVIDVPHPAAFTNHWGGQLAFGPGGLLFLSTGDGGSGGDPPNHAQNKESLEGKILRLKVLGAHRACGHAYCIPAGNPFRGATPGRGEIWALGLRNAWRFSVDQTTGDLWVGDVGQDRYEEIDKIPAGVAGANLGWSCREGPAEYKASRCSATTTYLEPVWTYGRDYGSTVTGGFVYRGSRYAGELAGAYLGADFGSGRVFVGGAGGLETVGHLDAITSFGEDDAHELWAVTYDGGLYELSAS
jgi:glucose/arabinose dehydrogenase